MTWAQVAALIDAERPKQTSKVVDGSSDDLAWLEGMASRG